MSHGQEITISQAVGIPLLQALITGGFTGAVAIAILVILHMGQALEYGLLVGFVVAWLSWLSYTNRFLSGLKDFDRPIRNYTQTETVRVNLLQTDNQSGLFLDIPLSPEKLAAVSRSIINSGSSFSFADLVSTRLLTRAEYESLRSYFLKRGLLFWSGGSHHMGCELTGAGRAILRHFAAPALPETEGYTGL